MGLYERGGKRVLDIGVGICGLVLFSPVMAAIAVLVWRDLGSPILFRQTRPGLDGKPFVLLKFRSMHNTELPNGVVLPDGARLTAFGNRLRATSLDELPELVNVVRGEMSLVGPRPLLLEYLPLYSSRQARRHRVRPGVTGWAQVNGRNAVEWNERLEMDSWYVDNVSFRLDLLIMVRTLKMVLSRHGVTGSGEATMRRFDGT